MGTGKIAVERDGDKLSLLIDSDIDPQDVSDGYHTFRELYHHRMLLSACLWNAWNQKGDIVCKSRKHSDGELCFGGGWFVVVAKIPTGQISYHYKEEYWDLFCIPEAERSPFPYDGHTPEDVEKRLKDYIENYLTRQWNAPKVPKHPHPLPWEV